MKIKWMRRVIVASLSALTGCSVRASPPANGELGRDQAVLASCSGVRPAAMVTIDVSGSGRDQNIADQHLDAVRMVVRRTAICGGHLRVTAFAGTSAVTRPLYDDELQLAGATDIARLRKVPALVDEVMATVDGSYQEALSTPPAGDGSDITGQYRLAGEYAAQLGSSYTLDFTLLTDGFQNTVAGAITHALTASEAIALADAVSVPSLKGATVTVAGLGRVAGAPPQSDTVEGLVQFYDAVCARTGAAKCTSVTDFTVGR